MMHSTLVIAVFDCLARTHAKGLFDFLAQARHKLRSVNSGVFQHPRRLSSSSSSRSLTEQQHSTGPPILHKKYFSSSRSLKKQQHSTGAYYFINLARRDDRREQLEKTLSSSNQELWQKLERVDAVDGKSINLTDADALKDFATADALQGALRKKQVATVEHYRGAFMKFHDHLTEGAVACAMSHHKALQAFANHPTADWALVLEDDIAAAVPHADKAVEALISRLPYDWDVVYLGYHFENTSLAAEDGRSVPLVPLDKRVSGLYAYIVSKEGARKILDCVFPINRQVDVAISGWLLNTGMLAFRVHHQHFLFHSLKSEEGMDSDVQTLKNVTKEEFDEWNNIMALATQIVKGSNDTQSLTTRFLDVYWKRKTTGSFQNISLRSSPDPGDNLRLPGSKAQLEALLAR